MDENVIGRNIRKYRKELKLRQKDIADHFGIDVSTVSMWERGKNAIPAERLFALADLLGVTADVLCGRIPGDLTFDELRMIQKFRALDDSHRAIILASIDAAYYQKNDAGVSAS